jgi:hypothetical protein
MSASAIRLRTSSASANRYRLRQPHIHARTPTVKRDISQGRPIHTGESAASNMSRLVCNADKAAPLNGVPNFGDDVEKTTQRRRC